MSAYTDETEWSRAKLLDELQSSAYYSGALRQRAAVPSKERVVAIRAELDRRAEVAEKRIAELETENAQLHKSLVAYGHFADSPLFED